MEFDLDWNKEREELEKIIEKNKSNEDACIYLFLDFDGVMNQFFRPGTKGYEDLVNGIDVDALDKECVKNINTLCKTYPIRTILSTSWRFSGIAYCEDCLRKAGLDESINVYGSTQIEHMMPRETEILQYLYDHQDFKGFIILDDIPMFNFNAYHVQCDPYVGFDEERLERAEYLINQFM